MTSKRRRVCHRCFYHVLTFSGICYSIAARQYEIYLFYQKHITLVQWNLSFGTPLFSGHLHLRDTNFDPETEKCSYNLCKCYLYSRDTSIQGTLILVPKVSLQWRFHCICFCLFLIKRQIIVNNDVIYTALNIIYHR